MKKFLTAVKQHPTHFTLVTCSHILLIFLIIYCISTNLFNVFTPTKVSLDSDPSASALEELESIYEQGTRYIQVSTPTLYYTGYDNTDFNKVTGHYYYSLDETSCTIYLLSNKMFSDNDNVPLTLSDLSFTARLSRNDANYKSLLRYMSTDLNWNYYSLSQCTGSIILDERNDFVWHGIFILIALIAVCAANVLQIINYGKLIKKDAMSDDLT